MSVLEKKKTEKKAHRAATTKIAKKITEVQPQEVEKPYLINNTNNTVFIYPEKGEGFTPFSLNGISIPKSNFSQDQLASKNLKNRIFLNLVKEATEEESKARVEQEEKRNNKYKITPQPTKSSCVNLESSNLGGLSNFFDKISEDDIKSFKDNFLGKLNDKINPIKIAEKPSVRIIDLLLSAAEEKLNEMVGIAVSEVKKDLNDKIDDLVEKTINSDNLIDRIKSAVKEPRVVKPEPITDPKGPIISGDDKILIKDGNETFVKHINDPSGCWTTEETK